LVNVGRSVGDTVLYPPPRHRDILPPGHAERHRRAEHLRSQPRLPQHLAVILVESAQ